MKEWSSVLDKYINKTIELVFDDGKRIKGILTKDTVYGYRIDKWGINPNFIEKIRIMSKEVE